MEDNSGHSTISFAVCRDRVSVLEHQSYVLRNHSLSGRHVFLIPFKMGSLLSHIHSFRLLEELKIDYLTYREKHLIVSPHATCNPIINELWHKRKLTGCSILSRDRTEIKSLRGFTSRYYYYDINNNTNQ